MHLIDIYRKGGYEQTRWQDEKPNVCMRYRQGGVVGPIVELVEGWWQPVLLEWAGDSEVSWFLWSRRYRVGAYCVS